MVPGLRFLWRKVCLGLSGTDRAEFSSPFHLWVVRTGQRTAGKDWHPQPPTEQSRAGGISVPGAETDLATRTVWQVPSQPLPRAAQGGLMSPPDAGSQLAAGR